MLRHDFKLFLKSDFLIGQHRIFDFEINQESECGEKNFEKWFHTRLNSQTINMFDEISGPASNTIKFLTYNRFMILMRWVFI